MCLERQCSVLCACALALSLSLSLRRSHLSALTLRARARFTLLYSYYLYYDPLSKVTGHCSGRLHVHHHLCRHACALHVRASPVSPLRGCFALCNGPSFHHQIIKQNLTLKHQSTVSVIHRREDIFANTLPPIVINRHSQRREPDKTPANLRVQQYF